MGYKLMWAGTTQETAEEAMSHPYQRIDSYITLIYTDRATDLFETATDSFLQQMSDDEKLWLLESVDKVAHEIEARKISEIRKKTIEFMEAFEEKLAIEKEKLDKANKKGVKQNG